MTDTPLMSQAENTPKASTLLAAMWAAEGNADEAETAIRADLETGALLLTGNFRGREAEIAKAPPGEN